MYNEVGEAANECTDEIHHIQIDFLKWGKWTKGIIMAQSVKLVIWFWTKIWKNSAKCIKATRNEVGEAASECTDEIPRSQVHYFKMANYSVAWKMSFGFEWQIWEMDMRGFCKFIRLHVMRDKKK